jgi:colicin import membrane protein
MNADTDMPFERREEPGKRKALILAVLVHALLAGFLFFGIRWQTKHEAVEVELWSDVPQGAYKPPAPAPEPKPEPRPEPKPEPRPEPKPEVKPEPKPLPKPDIAVKEEKKKPEPKKEEQKPEPKPEPKKEEKKLDPRDIFKEQIEREEKQRKQDQTRDMMREQAHRELTQQQAAGRDAATAASRRKGVESYADKIRAKVRGNLGFVSVNGNPAAKFIVTQLPSGEIINVRMTRSSGVPTYDSAVERAILKSSPLPLPDDKSFFERELNITFCPQEASGGCPQ